MKICNQCNIEKDLNSFYKRKDNKDGYRNNCKACHNINTKISTKKYQQKEDVKEKAKEHNKKYWIDNKEYLTTKNKEKYSKNREKYLIQKKNYYQLNKEEIIRRAIDFSRNKRIRDPKFKLICNIRKNIYNSLIYKGYKKNTKTEKILGCTFEEFRIHLECKFECWMDWDNYCKYNGELNYGWDIDHIVPISSAETEEDVIRLNHYTNLQPLCSYTNRYIKKDQF